jgi:AGZA family xanthine/uracil permease-like MFS transporter
MERFFKLKAHGTTVRTEVVAGITTFITMAYVILVNPNILSITGMDKGAVFTATVLSAVIATLIMALLANVPYAQAPGMGMNAFFTFTVCLGLKFSWQQALAIVLISGLVNTLITVTKVRKMIIQAIPSSLQYAISGGIGLFIAYIGFIDAKILNFTTSASDAIVKFPDGGGIFNSAIPSLFHFNDAGAILAIIGIIIIVVLMLLKVRGSILIGIIATTLIGIPMGVTKVPHFNAASFVPPSLEPTLFKLDIRGLFADPSKFFLVLTTILAFVLSDIFDCIGTFLGTGLKSGIFSEKDLKDNKRGIFATKLDRALFADLTATTIGSLLGTSNTTTYVESAAGISAGGRTGLTAFTVAGFFLLSLFLAPIALMVPAAATAPALIVVGILMMESMAKVAWNEFEDAAAAFFTAVIMPFTYSIANGVACGFIFYVITKIAKGKAKQVHPIIYIVALLFISRFVFEAIRML